MSNLVNHAKRELELIREDSDTIDGYLKVIQAFADWGHSGGSASFAIPIINELLQFNNLSPLTTDPDEWTHIHKDLTSGEELWQSQRNPRAFSMDGGRTYYYVDDHNTIIHSLPKKV